MADHIHTFKPGAAVTYAASAAVTGGRLVEVSGSKTVAHAALDSVKVVGAAAQDATVGEDVLVLRGGVQKLVASAAIAAGARVKPAAAGKVVTVGAGERGLGTARTAATGADQLLEIVLD